MIGLARVVLVWAAAAAAVLICASQMPETVLAGLAAGVVGIVCGTAANMATTDLIERERARDRARREREATFRHRRGQVFPREAGDE